MLCENGLVAVDLNTSGYQSNRNKMAKKYVVTFITLCFKRAHVEVMVICSWDAAGFTYKLNKM